jgi:hypothetical protein|mmetsp:Transcript_41269/g.69442  ORF Transcript_41269/g.69442 Transcript_41269/m.69442 type:complete len:123 (-) Transcript_41269:483-851(-)
MQRPFHDQSCEKYRICYVSTVLIPCRTVELLLVSLSSHAAPWVLVDDAQHCAMVFCMFQKCQIVLLLGLYSNWLTVGGPRDVTFMDIIRRASWLSSNASMLRQPAEMKTKDTPTLDMCYLHV